MVQTRQNKKDEVYPITTLSTSRNHYREESSHDHNTYSKERDSCPSIPSRQGSYYQEKEKTSKKSNKEQTSEKSNKEKTSEKSNKIQKTTEKEENNKKTEKGNMQESQ